MFIKKRAQQIVVGAFTLLLIAGLVWIGHRLYVPGAYGIEKVQQYDTTTGVSYILESGGVHDYLAFTSNGEEIVFVARRGLTLFIRGDQRWDDWGSTNASGVFVLNLSTRQVGEITPEVYTERQVWYDLAASLSAENPNSRDPKRSLLTPSGKLRAEQSSSTVRILDTASGETVHTFHAKQYTTLTPMAFLDESHLIFLKEERPFGRVALEYQFFPGVRGSLEIYDVHSGKRTAFLPLGKWHLITRLIVSPDGQYIAVIPASHTWWTIFEVPRADLSTVVEDSDTIVLYKIE